MAEKREQKTVAAVQSNYIPWKGYFALIDRADEVILYDDAQYTRRDWRNRNRIKTPRGSRWLTIPIRSKGRYAQRIREVEIADPRWPEKHWKAIRLNYSRAPFFDQYEDFLEDLFLGCREAYLSGVNYRFLSALCNLIDIETSLRWSMEYELTREDRTGKLVELCAQAGATRYLSGPAAREYLDERAFQRAGIEVLWMDYSNYPTYPQLHGDFDHAVSILDPLLMLGSDVRSCMVSGR